jgi:hypothetical protein
VTALFAVASPVRYSMGTGGESFHHHTTRSAMTHTLCDGYQTFEFRPAADGVAVTRRAPQPVHTRKGIKAGPLKITGQFQMTTAEARQLWKSLIKDGAFKG